MILRFRCRQKYGREYRGCNNGCDQINNNDNLKTNREEIVKPSVENMTFVFIRV